MFDNLIKGCYDKKIINSYQTTGCVRINHSAQGNTLAAYMDLLNVSNR